jgi:Peptidase family M23
MSITLPFKTGQIQSQGFGFTEFATSPQGKAIYGSHGHEGNDYFSNEDPKLYSIASGTVIIDNDSYQGADSGLFTSYGNHVVIKDDDTNRAWYYCHLDSNCVYAGQHVNQGDMIGVMGGSGAGNRVAWGAHLHLGRAELDGNGSRLNRGSIAYGFIDGSDDLQAAIDKYNTPVAESKPVAEEPKKLTTREGFDYVLKYYPEFKSDVDNGWPIARFDIDGVGEGIKMLAYSVIQPLFNRAENLQKLIDLKAATPTVEVKKNESQSQFEPVAKVITNEEEIKKLQTQILIAQSQKDREALENNPLVIKSQQPLEATQTFKVGTAGSIISLIGVAVTNFTDQIKSIPGLGNIGEFLANNQCNLSYLIIMFLGLVILFMLYHKNLTQNLIKDNIAQIVDTKTVNFDEIIKNISNNIDKVSNISNQASDVLKQIDDVKTKTSSIFKK